MRKNPTNLDLHVTLARIEQRQISIAEKLEDVKTTQKTHQQQDDKQFSDLNNNLNGLHKYAASVAIIASGVGAAMIWAWNRLTGRA